MTQHNNPNNQPGQGGQAFNNGYQGRGQRGNFSPPRTHYEWLQQQRIRLQQDLIRVQYQKDFWEQRVAQVQQMRQTTVSRKLGLVGLTALSVLSGNKQVTMNERNHFYRMQRLDQSEQNAQTRLLELDNQLAAIQEQIDQINFEIELETNPQANNNTGPNVP